MKPYYPRYWVINLILLTILLKPIPIKAQSELEVYGFSEFESFINTYPDQNISEAVKKTEIRSRLELTYGRQDLYLFLATDLYLQPNLSGDDDAYDDHYGNKEDLAANLRIASTGYEWSFNELFINYSIYPLRFRLGNQIFNWGTADIFNPTAYFNPYDLRDLFFRDDNEFKQGVPSFAAMYFSDNYTLELVFTALQPPMLFAAENHFWSLNMNADLYDIFFLESKRPDVNFKNSGIGARASTTLFQTDISLSFYHGPYKEPLFVPVSVSFPPNEPIKILVEPQYFLVEMVGFDFSKALGDVVFQMEASYSAGKHGIANQDPAEPLTVELPFKVHRSPYISYSMGFNYFIPLSELFESHDGEAVFTLDWYQSRYFEDNLVSPYLSDLLTLRFQDTFLSGKLRTELTAIFETHHSGTLIWPEIGYDFQNGLSVGLAYGAMDGKSSNDAIEPVLYHFRNNDIVIVKVRYDF